MSKWFTNKCALSQAK